MEVYIMNWIFFILICMFVLEVYFVAKKDKCMYETKNSIKRKVFPIIKVRLMEALEYTDEHIEKMCLDVVENNIIKTKYTNNLSYNILIEDMKCSENTKLLSVHIFNNKREIFNTVDEKKYFFITSKNGNYYISDSDNIDVV